MVSGQPLGTCEAGKCGGCGGPGEPCCPGTGVSGENRCTDPTTICQSTSGISSGVCARCGGPDQPCCASNTCSDGGCCVQFSGSFSNNRCAAAGQACGGTAVAMVCASGSCGTCGGLGQPCCNGPYGSFCSAPRSQCSQVSGTQVCIQAGMANACSAL
jgi:hypothetical protein